MEQNNLETTVQKILNKIEEKERTDRERKEKQKENALILLIVACGVAIGTILGQLVIRLF